MLGRNFAIPKGESSVGFLRNPLIFPISDPKLDNVTKTRMEIWAKKCCKVENATGSAGTEWQSKLLVVTEKRLFIVASESNRKKDDYTQAFNDRLLIYNSIPLEDITSISFIGPQGAIKCERGIGAISRSARVKTWLFEPVMRCREVILRQIRLTELVLSMNPLTKLRTRRLLKARVSTITTTLF